MNQNYKTFGYLLIGLSAILLLILILVKINTDKQAAFLCQKFHENQLDMNECPVHQNNTFWSNTSWMITAGFGIVILILGVGIYLLFFLKPLIAESKKEFKPIDFSKLEDDEKKIYEIIRGKNGSAYQSDLIKETGYSKVRVTRILDKLETNDILERRRRGMTNIIVLK